MRTDRCTVPGMLPGRLLRFAAVALLAVALHGLATAVQDGGQVSRFGRYQGYSWPRYDAWSRESFYIEVRDGTRLACDLYRPTRDGVVAAEPLPLVWTHDRYHRTTTMAGLTVSKLEVYPWLMTLLRHGYLVAAVDVRGAGASFGTWQGIFNAEETEDAYDVVEWFAAQEWCNGKVGMYGGSYLGSTQLMVASTAPPHLEAIFPWVAPVDLYRLAWSGGIFRRPLLERWSALTHALDRSAAVAPVDADPEGIERAAAQREHVDNLDLAAVLGALPFRDATDATLELRPYEEWSPSFLLDEIEQSGVAIYHVGGWYDLFPDGALLALRSLDNPQKVVLGPWFHVQSGGVDWNAESLRWFDHWLKDIDNGVLDEPPIHYATIHAELGQEWSSTATWPPAEAVATDYWLRSGPSGSVDSLNDGILAPQAPQQPAVDAYTVRDDTTSGTVTRWSNAVGVGGRRPAYTDLQGNDRLGLTWTSEPLATARQITGHPLLHLWIESDAKDVDLFAYLEDVRPDGFSEYVTEGCLRASHRAGRPPPFDSGGLPWHGGFEADVAPLPAGPGELSFALFPTSYRFRAGHRIRVTVTGTDRDNAATTVGTPPPTIQVHRGPDRPSRIVLPLMPAPTADTAGSDELHGRILLAGDSFPRDRPAAPWEVDAARKPDTRVFCEAGQLVIDARASRYAWIERRAPPGTALVEAVVRLETDQGTDWGPGLALLWRDHLVRAYLRADGKLGIQDGSRHSVGDVSVDADTWYRLRLRLDSRRVTIEVAPAEEGWRQLYERPREGLAGRPTMIRLGKMAPSGLPRDGPAPGPEGRCRIRDFRVYSERR